jgi:hypothetical protein
MLLSAAAVISVSLAVFLRVRRHLKSPAARPGNPAPEGPAKDAGDRSLDDLTKHN